MRIFWFFAVGLIVCAFTCGPLVTQALSRDQDWVVGDIPPDFPKLQPFDGEGEEQEIWGGSRSKWADLVALRIPGNDQAGEHLCSGVLLRGDTILTAAHCLCSESRSVTKAPFVATAESKDLTKLSAWREAADFELFPGWSCAAMGQVSDLAVVFLAPRFDRPPARFLQRINKADAKPFPKCRPTLAAKTWDQKIMKLSDLLIRQPSTTFNVAGFGLDENGRKGVPMEVTLSITSLACSGKKAHLRWCKPFREMILGADSRDRGTRDSCGGDSGGPAFWQAADGTRVLVGMVSRGVPPLIGEPSLSCGLGGIYTFVGIPDVSDWLRNIGVGPEDLCS
ncbi:trypsin-like serine protease [Rhizobium leguminosarum]|uniref:trypsin-like serine protease n=1 Tax=Rhizobium leguminosarum TaxID=384 RepID=UPI003F976A17